MITIFNRREVLNSFSMKDQSNVRSVLKANDIEYTMKVVNLNSPTLFSGNRGEFGSLGLNDEYSREYYIYVHKKDFEKAQFIISKARDSYY